MNIIYICILVGCKGCRVASANFVIKRLCSIAKSKWYQLGAMLKIDIKQLDEIEDRHRDSGSRFTKMIDIWVTQDPFPTWQKITSAIDAIGEDQLTLQNKHLKEEFCSDCCYA